VPAPEQPEARILVVDDDPDIRTLREIVLGDEGFDVRGAGNGREAVEALAHRPDLVLVDLATPHAIGPEALSAFRRHPEPLAFIVVSGLGGDESWVPGYADDHIAKPFSPRELVAHVRAVLGRDGQTVASG
jgi:two-component system OmpR family response regulator